MRKRLAFVVMVSAVSLYATDFWNKIFTDWTDKEVQKMMESSPWAKKLDLVAGGASAANSADQFRPSAGIGDTKSPGSLAGAGSGTVTVFVRWQSALPVKQAFVKAKFGDQVTSSPEAQQILTTAEPNYLVSVEGVDRKNAAGDPEVLKQTLLEQTALVIKGKEPIHPIDVRTTVQPKICFTFVFPKTDPITADDKEVEFQTKVGALGIKEKFRLKDMMYYGKLEL